MTEKRGNRLLALLAVLTLLMAACGGTGGEEGTTTSAGEEATDLPWATRPRPRRLRREPPPRRPPRLSVPTRTTACSFSPPDEANQPAGANWRLGIEMAVAEINEAGGILGCQIVRRVPGHPGRPGRLEAGRRRHGRGQSVRLPRHRVLLEHHRQHGRGPAGRDPDVRRCRGPAVTNREENGDNDFIYRTSFGVDTAADKFISYIVDQGVTSVDMIYKNDEFGAGVRRCVRRRPSKRSGSRSSSTSRCSRIRSTCRPRSPNSPVASADAIFAFMTEIETAAFLDEVQAQALRSRSTAATCSAPRRPSPSSSRVPPTGPSHTSGLAQRLRRRVRRLEHSPCGVPPAARSARPQQHQGLHGGLHRQGDHRADRLDSTTRSSPTTCTAPRSRSTTSRACSST